MTYHPARGLHPFDVPHPSATVRDMTDTPVDPDPLDPDPADPPDPDAM